MMKKGFMLALVSMWAKMWSHWNVGGYSSSDKGVDRFRGIANKKRGKFKRR
jgi:hypothetical protein